MPRYTARKFSESIPVQRDLPAPRETGWTKRAIDEIAAKIAGKLNYEPGAELEPVVEKLNGTVKLGSADETGSTGFLRVEKDGTFLIALSPIPGEYRNRFTIAHELGHYFLHAKIGKQPLFATRQAGSRVEWEANWFAGGFLMPAEAFVKAWKEFNGEAGHLINRFKVSGGAIQIRAETLREMGKLG